MRVFTIILLLIVGMWETGYAQSDYDTAYYRSFEQQITGRFYFSRKFTTLSFRNRREDYSFRYRPNTTLNMGVGATYKWATLNLAYGFGFLNPDRGRGDTRYLDLQFHSYGRKVTVDVLGQFYKGFYLSPRGRAAGSDKEYYRRPDLRASIIGATVQHVLNYRKFSYRAAFLQNEWQKKSAGSVLIGVELYGGGINADSTIIPGAVNEEAAITGLDRLRFVELGPNVGYAYSFVYREHFFITGAASVSLNVGINSLYDDNGRASKVGVSPNTLFRVSAGYNGSVWSVNLLYVSNGLQLASNSTNTNVMLNTGNVRMNFVYRFRPGREVKRYLKVIDEVEEEIE